MSSPSDNASTPDSAVIESPVTSPSPSDGEPTPASGSGVQPPRLPPLRSSSDPPTAASMTASSTPLGTLNAARRPTGTQTSLASMRAGALPQDMQEKMKAFHLSRQGAPPAPNLRLPGKAPLLTMPSAPAHPTAERLPLSSGGGLASPTATQAPGGALVGGMGGLQVPSRPQPQNWTSAPAVPRPKQGLGARRGLKLPGGLPGAAPSPAPVAGSDAVEGATPSASADGTATIHGQTGSVPGHNESSSETGSLFNKFSQIVDTKTGSLKFAGKAVIHGKGVDFSSGSSFSISLDEVDTIEELGKGNYGTVYKVRHSRPQIRRPGLGLKGNRAATSVSTSSTANSSPVSGAAEDPRESGKEPVLVPEASATNRVKESTTGIIMAMKEIRLELDEAKFAAIIMELDILHRCVSPFIVDFYGAFFQEGAVYICLEYMDGGSIDKLYNEGIPESVLRKITLSTVMGLKSLKDEHNIIHRDVKPTNILVNSRGQIKICDFGVSGNLVASIAKTNIGCQSYMAPERIASGGIAQAGANPGGGTYSVQSDIWSLGLTIIECALGRYPYPPETYNNIFSQLSAIVDGDPPDLPAEGFSDDARDFVKGCLHKIPKLRPTYAMLLRHRWLAPLLKPPTIPEDGQIGAPAITTKLEHTENGFLDTADEEVAAWVNAALEKRRNGTTGSKEKPALHAAPLNAVPVTNNVGATGTAAL
ncbi:MAG: hypothetical protein M1817_001015 [Caeruleum heppii]|nr:MAG: hypothetical protein M1817_001015 [Caeruleum heppii]